GTAQALPPVRALPRDGGQQGPPKRRGGAAPGRLEREGHSLLPRDQQEDRLPGLGQVARRRRRGPGGQAPGTAQGRAKHGPRHHGLCPQDAGEPRARRLPRPRGPRAEEGRL
ncbi:MAG: hypothetical protein AVDCRST_MAG22-2884, partial [uncultured Rubrobacteraceae bacterium]